MRLALLALSSIIVEMPAWQGAGIGCRQRPRMMNGALHGDDTGDAEDPVAAASALLQSQRATSGDEAFSGTTWSVLLQMDEGGNSIFTTELMEDGSCRFSDTDALSSWQSEADYVVIEKPKGFFDQTLFLSAKLSPPVAKVKKWRLIDGVVQRTNATAAKGDDAMEDAEEQVSIEQIGTFGANEFEESLLGVMARFQKD